MVISGESDVKLGLEKKDLLPGDYPMPPKETPLMEMEFIKGPYLEEDKMTPTSGKEESKSSVGEINTYLGTYDNYYGNRISGEQLNQFGFLVNLVNDRLNYETQGAGYINYDFSGDFNYSFEKAIKLGLTLSMDDETIDTPYSGVSGFLRSRKTFIL